MKSIYILLLLSLSLSAYEGCGDSKKSALLFLSGNIRTSIDNTIEVETSSNGESIEKRVQIMSKNATHLSLVKIKHYMKDGNHCASIKEKDQEENTVELFKAAMLLEKKNLPSNIDEKIKKLSQWLDNLEELGYLIPSFYKANKSNITKAQATVAILAKEKIFQDLYDDAIAQANSLVYKACEDTKEEAYSELNKKLFKNKTKKTDDEGILSKASSFFSNMFSSNKDQSIMLDVFESQVIYAKKDKKHCAIIKKSDLLSVAITLNADVARFDITSLSSIPKRRYDEILNYQEHLNVTKALIELFPKKFNKSDFAKITKTKQALADSLKNTNPQFVKFTVSGAEGIVIKLDDKTVKINQEIYLKIGEHTYTISAKDRCPIIDTLSIKLKEDEEISKDFTTMLYPTVLFATDKSPSIIVDGRSLKVNVANKIPKCQGEIRYLVKFSGQSRDGEISLSPNGKTTIDLEFLTSQELAVYNDAKVKKFTTTTLTKFSESLTSVVSKNLKFSIENNPEHGELTLHAGGTFSYKSDEKFVGQDSFEYTVEANGEDSPPKIVNIIVNPSTAPIAIVPIKKDENLTQVIVAPIKEAVEKVEAEKQDKFNALMNKYRENVDQLKKFQSKYPDLFKGWLDTIKVP